MPSSIGNRKNERGVSLHCLIIVNKRLTMTAILNVASKFPNIIAQNDLHKLTVSGCEFPFTDLP